MVTWQNVVVHQGKVYYLYTKSEKSCKHGKKLKNVIHIMETLEKLFPKTLQFRKSLQWSHRKFRMLLLAYMMTIQKNVVMLHMTILDIICFKTW